MGLFGIKNKKNSFDIKVLYAGRTNSIKDIKANSLDEDYASSIMKAVGNPMMEGIPLDALQSAFVTLHKNILESGMKLNENKMVDRCVAGIYQTIIYSIDGDKVEIMYNSQKRNGTADFWFDLSCKVNMTHNEFISNILSPTLDELKENGFRFSIKN